jgi:hypothetical protein
MNVGTWGGVRHPERPFLGQAGLAFFLVPCGSHDLGIVRFLLALCNGPLRLGSLYIVPMPP